LTGGHCFGRLGTITATNPKSLSGRMNDRVNMRGRVPRLACRSRREAFPDLEFGGTADPIAEGDYVVGFWEGGGTHTGPAFSDFVIGSLPAASGRKMRFKGITVLRVENGKIAEEVGLDDGLTAMQQLGIVRAV
jgi:predicted ester cyclase